MEKAFDKRVIGPPLLNSTDDFGGVMASGSKDLALIDNSSLSRGGTWGKLVGPQRLLGEVRHRLSVW